MLFLPLHLAHTAVVVSSIVGRDVSVECLISNSNWTE